MERNRKSVRFQPYHKSLRNTEQLCSGDTNAEGRSCPICLDSETYADFHTLPCSHKFHAVCLVHWLRRNLCCPVCRSNLNQNVDEADESDQREDGEEEAGEPYNDVENADEELFEEMLSGFRNEERLESDEGLGSDTDEYSDTVLYEESPEDWNGESDDNEWQWSSDTTEDGDTVLNEERLEEVDEESESDEEQQSGHAVEDDDEF